MPKNDSKKPLSNPDGYKALISALSKLSSKGKDMTITVFLPPLSKVQKLVSFWYFLLCTIMLMV